MAACVRWACGGQGLLELHEATALKETKLPLETIVGWAADLVTAQSRTDVTVDGSPKMLFVDPAGLVSAEDKKEGRVCW